MEQKKSNKKLMIIVAIAVVVIVAIVGVVVFMSSKGGNGTEEKNNNAVEGTNKADKLTIEDVVGTYKNIGLLSNEDVTYTLNSNSTFDQTAKINPLRLKGTFTVNPEGKFTLNENKSSTSETFVKYKDYFYETSKIARFDTDEDYGLKLTLNENNRTNQIFKSYVFEVGTNTQYVLTLQFNEDGTFKLYKYYHLITGYKTTNNEDFSGTYNIKDDIIKLSYNGKEDTLLIINNVIYFSILEKQ